ncbi:plastocyanin [Caballeronia arationis]|jgi:plastocyanin|uniref:Plastocyanin n=1 Tax=Caballeronia arationis TaxID=1777142 RepID=A0A7Z7I3K8_9BURK|nr:cupredoxin family copper-binding protein [Caballeronia arationis]SAK47322.1 plastocyanin [Caballeronia arationis]SOE59326.1 Plastocyanin [Caballeronia arationis]
MNESRRHAALTLFALAAIAASPLARSANASDATIHIDNFAFSPQTLRVAAGTKVTWVNRDDMIHTIVDENKSTFKSTPMDTDQSFSFVFAKPGTYRYFCSIHPQMTGTVVVE